MASSFGKELKISVFGESHGQGIGVLVDGLPAGETIDVEALQAFLDRRKPGGTPLATARKEADVPEFLSGVTEGKTNGFPLCAMIRNTDTRSKDYKALLDLPRPAHADYTAWVKWGGSADMRGGGHFSARLTAPLCVAGGIAKQLLERKGIYIGAHLAAVGGVEDIAFPLYPDAELFDEVACKAMPVVDDARGEKMAEVIRTAAADQDSVGGIVECAVTGVPAGIGGPMFDGVENRLAQALFGIPAVKGLEFGSGFAGASSRGSENNDAFRMNGETVVTETNNAGGINGGITNGMPVVFRLALKPTPSIAKQQRTIRLSAMENENLSIVGRHDPCVALRAVPVAEAVAALVILDMMLEEGKM